MYTAQMVTMRLFRFIERGEPAAYRLVNSQQHMGSHDPRMKTGRITRKGVILGELMRNRPALAGLSFFAGTIDMKNTSIKAQAMVEFALVLPILLLVIVGLLEVGRAIFMYSALFSAAREGVRYGSAAGNNLIGVPLYQDCAGIREAARTAGILLNLQDDEIVIEYDHGPETGVFASCSDPDGADENVIVTSGDRILVNISTNYAPMIPLFVPLASRTIEISSARTITGVITIHDTP